ncbi:hypothetical protein ACO2JO_06240 [Leptospira interrogans]
MILDEILQAIGKLAYLRGNASLELAGDVFAGVARPALCRIGGNDPQDPGILAAQQVGDQGRIIDALVGLAEGRAATEIFENDVKIPV